MTPFLLTFLLMRMSEHLFLPASTYDGFFVTGVLYCSDQNGVVGRRGVTVIKAISNHCLDCSSLCCIGIRCTFAIISKEVPTQS